MTHHQYLRQKAEMDILDHTTNTFDSSPAPKTKAEMNIQDHTTNTFDSSPVPQTKGEMDIIDHTINTTARHQYLRQRSRWTN